MFHKEKIGIAGIVNRVDDMVYVKDSTQFIPRVTISILYGNDNTKQDLEHPFETLKIIAFRKLGLLAEKKIYVGSKISVEGEIYRHEFNCNLKDKLELPFKGETLIKAEKIKITRQLKEYESITDELETIIEDDLQEYLDKDLTTAEIGDDALYIIYESSLEPILEEMLGTKFQQRVWEEITKIPRGEVRTYKEIAIAIGKPNSARAVANACGKNPRPIEIPCHRVIRSDGSLGGYKGGDIMEKRLLLLEEGLKFK
tara:strand:+ start:312 stop:1079 length:768 start_codon:yes stop_codon:yes gene_type:complete